MMVCGKASPTFGHANAFFRAYRPYNESNSKEMNNDNDLNLHSMTNIGLSTQNCRAGIATNDGKV